MTRAPGTRGAHRAPPRHDTRIFAIVAAFLAIAILGWTTLRVVGDGAAQAGVAGPPTASASRPSAPTCPPPLQIGAPAAYRAGWESVAQAYAASGGAESGCPAVGVVARPSGAVAAGDVAGLHAWLPEDRSWVDQAGAATRAAIVGAPTAVAHSPLMLSMPTPMAQALGVAQGRFTAQVLQEMITLRRSWADAGAPAWGHLRLALPDPASSATGAVGFAALTQVATGGKPPTTLDYAAPTANQLAMIRLEHRVARTPADDAAAIEALGPVDLKVGPDDPAGPGMAVTTEAAVLAAPVGPTPRTAVYLGGGAVGVFMHLVALDASRAPEVARFATFLDSPQGSTAMAAAGLRTTQGAPDPQLLADAGIVAASGGGRATPLPSATVAATARTFAFMRIRLSSLVVLDTSGSMRAGFPGSRTSKYDVVRQLAKVTLDVASPQARSGLVTFHGGERGQMNIRVAAPLMANGAIDGGVPHAQRMLAAVESAPLAGGTPLYNAILTGYRIALASYDKAYVNQVVVLTDGDNRDVSRSITLAQLVSELRKLVDPRRPIKVILIGYGPRADLASLRAVARGAGGRVFAISSLATVNDVTRQALFTP